MLPHRGKGLRAPNVVTSFALETVSSQFPFQSLSPEQLLLFLRGCLVPLFELKPLLKGVVSRVRERSRSLKNTSRTPSVNGP